MTAEIVLDPFGELVDIFNELCDEDVSIMFVTGLKEEEGVWGQTSLSETEGNLVQIDVSCPVEGAVEVLAHELAHVATGKDCSEDHGPEWEGWFARIHTEYCKRVQEIQDNG